MIQLCRALSMRISFRGKVCSIRTWLRNMINAAESLLSRVMCSTESCDLICEIG